VKGSKKKHNKGRRESGNAPLEKDKGNSFSLGLTHAGTDRLEHEDATVGASGIISLVPQHRYSMT